jgi:hypothetical protein
MAERLGNAWISAAQSVLDEYALRNQAENAEPPQPYVGPMDDRSYQIISDTKQDAFNVQRLFQTVAVGPNPPYKLFTMAEYGEIQVKDDIDYLFAT